MENHLLLVQETSQLVFNPM